jgi:hypothetical protein
MAPPIKKTPSEKEVAKALKTFSDRFASISAKDAYMRMESGTIAFYRALNEGIAETAALLRDITAVIRCGVVPTACIIQEKDVVVFLRELKRLEDLVAKHKRRLGKTLDKAEAAEAAADEAETETEPLKGAPPRHVLSADTRRHLAVLRLACERLPTPAEIRTAYLACVIVVHPDKGGSSDAFRSTKNAHDALNAEVRRLIPI